MDSAVTGLQSEQQVERLGTTLSMDPDSGSRGDGCAGPQLEVCPAQGGEEREKRGRIVGGVV